MNYNKLKLRDRVNDQIKESKEKARYKVKHTKKATRDQKKFMTKLDIKIPKGCSKQRASVLISLKLNLNASRDFGDI